MAPSSVPLTTFPPGLFVRASAGLKPGGMPVLRDLANGNHQPLVSPGKTLLGDDTPLAVTSPDGTAFVYNSWSWSVLPDPVTNGHGTGRPSLRLHFLNTGTDTLLADGAQSVAWGRDGLAFTAGVHADFQTSDQVYSTTIVVRSAPDAPDRVLLGVPGNYTVNAWAGSSVIYTTVPIEQESYGSVRSLSAQGAVTVLADNSEFVAVSPDGTRILVEALHEGPVPTELSIVDVATAKVLSTFEAPLTSVTTAVWRSGVIVVAGQKVDGELPELLSFPDVNPTSGRALDPNFPSTANISELYSTNSSTEFVALINPLGPQPDQTNFWLVKCNIASSKCQTRQMDIAISSQVGKVRNPSRPVPSTQPEEDQ